MTCPLHSPRAGAGSLVSMGLTLLPPIMHSPAGLSNRVPHPPLTQTSRGTPHRWPSLSAYCESVYAPSLPGPQSTCSLRSHQPLCGLWEPHRILPVCSFELKLGNLFLLLALAASPKLVIRSMRLEPCLTLLLYSPCAWPRARHLVRVGETEQCGDPGWCHPWPF